MITMSLRRLAGVAVALAAAAGITAPAALAATHTQQLNLSAELVRQPPGKPWIVNLNLGAQLGMDDLSVPEPVTNMKFSFTTGAKVHGEAFGTCTKAILQEKGPSACPSNSHLGSGTAVAEALATKFPTDEVTVFNGPGNAKSRKLLVYARAIDTVVIILEGTLKTTPGKYGFVLNIPVPPIHTVGEGNDASITSFDVKVGGFGRVKGKKGKVPFIEAPTSCKAPGWPFLGEFTYADGATGSSAATIPCILKATNS
jgi:hypothetical protein